MPSIIIYYYNLMGPPSYMRVHRWKKTSLWGARLHLCTIHWKYCDLQGLF